MSGSTALTFVHVLAAVGWVGGQLVLSWLRPRAVGEADDVAWRISEGIATVAWAAYAVLWATGLLNLMAVGDATLDDRYGAVVLAKLAAVAVSGLSARSVLAAGTVRGIRTAGTVNAGTALVVLYLGVLLAHG